MPIDSIAHYLGRKLYREDGPASVAFDLQSGRRTHETWYETGGKHRVDGPAAIYWDAGSGKVTSMEWFCHGELHRGGGLPASLEIDPLTDIVTKETYAEYGRHHRLHGPAIILRHPSSGEVIHEECWIDGRQYSGLPSTPTPPATVGIAEDVVLASHGHTRASPKPTGP